MLATLAPRPQASVTWTPLDERWYSSIGGGRSDSGAVIVPESALSIAVVYRAINVLAHAVASIPLVLYERDGEDQKVRARKNPLYRILHDQPAPHLTSFRWRHMMVAQSILWGNHYAELRAGYGGISSIVPLSPDTTRIVDQTSDGRLVYVTRDLSPKGWGEERRLIQDNVLHIRGFSLDGKEGLPLTKFARNAMGLALTAEKHGSMFLRRGHRLQGILSTDSAMKDDVRKINEDAFNSAYGGSGATNGTALLTGGMKYQALQGSNKDSQWTEAREFQVEELLRFLGVPGVLVGLPEGVAYNSSEQFFLSFVTHSVRPLTENIAAELNTSVVTDPETNFCDFVLAGLLKGDVASRYSAYQIGINSGFLSRQEVRGLEDLNRGPDALEEFLEPLNMVEAGTREEEGDEEIVPAIPARRPPAPAPEEEEARARLGTIAKRAIARIVRKEVAAISGSGNKKGAASRYATNPEGWAGWLESFYSEHSTLIAEDLGLDPLAATAYCRDQMERCRTLSAIPVTMEADSVTRLSALTPGLEPSHA